jgi:hypothetical protein
MGMTRAELLEHIDREAAVRIPFESTLGNPMIVLTGFNLWNVIDDGMLTWFIDHQIIPEVLGVTKSATIKGTQIVFKFNTKKEATMFRMRWV